MPICDTCVERDGCTDRRRWKEEYNEEPAGCSGYKKRETRYDFVKRMRMEDLAVAIATIVAYCGNDLCGKHCPLYPLCYSQGITAIDWLKQEVSDDV